MKNNKLPAVQYLEPRSRSDQLLTEFNSFDEPRRSAILRASIQTFTGDTIETHFDKINSAYDYSDRKPTRSNCIFFLLHFKKGKPSLHLSKSIAANAALC